MATATTDSASKLRSNFFIFRQLRAQLFVCITRAEENIEDELTRARVYYDVKVSFLFKTELEETIFTCDLWEIRRMYGFRFRE